MIERLYYGKESGVRKMEGSVVKVDKKERQTIVSSLEFQSTILQSKNRIKVRLQKKCCHRYRKVPN